MLLSGASDASDGQIQIQTASPPPNTPGISRTTLIISPLRLESSQAFQYSHVELLIHGKHGISTRTVGPAAAHLNQQLLTGGWRHVDGGKE